MIPLIKLLKIVLPVATVTTATIVTTSLISFSKKETDKDKENKDQILDDLELKAEEFKERTMLYSKDGTGDSVELKEEMKEEIMKFLKDKGNMDNLQGLGKETPDLEKLKKILDSLKNNSPENNKAQTNDQKGGQGLDDKSASSQDQIGKQMPNIPQYDELSPEEENDFKGPQQSDDEILKNKEEKGNSGEFKADVDSDGALRQEGADKNLDEISPTFSESKGSDPLSVEDDSDAKKPEISDGQDEKNNLQNAEDGDQLEKTNILQKDEEKPEDSSSSVDATVEQQPVLENRSGGFDNDSSHSRDISDSIAENGKNDSTGEVGDGENVGGSSNGGPELSEDAIRKLEELSGQMSDLAIKLQELSR